MATDNNILLTGDERDAYIAKRFNNKLTGQALLDYVDANSTKSHTENCTACGYLKELKEGNMGCDYVAYFEAILDARKANGEYEEPEQSGADWYDSLDDDAHELYDMIEETCPEFDKLDADECQEFMDKLSDHGITTAEQFGDAYYYQTNSWYAERDFAQYVATEINCLDMDALGYIVIDWQATWDCNLRHDFFTIEFGGETYFFHNGF